TPTSRQCRRRPTAGRGISRTGSGTDERAIAPPRRPDRTSLFTARERAENPFAPSHGRAASVRAETGQEDLFSSPHRRPAGCNPESATSACSRPPGDRLLPCIRQLGRREAPHHGNDAIVAANSMKSQGKREYP